jgi:hypothetical protein
VDGEPHFNEKFKAIRDKKERFFESRKVTCRGRIFAMRLSVKETTGG